MNKERILKATEVDPRKHEIYNNSLKKWVTPTLGHYELSVQITADSWEFYEVSDSVLLIVRDRKPDSLEKLLHDLYIKQSKEVALGVDFAAMVTRHVREQIETFSMWFAQDQILSKKIEDQIDLTTRNNFPTQDITNTIVSLIIYHLKEQLSPPESI